MPLAGESRGKTEVRRQLQLMLDMFEFLAFVVDTIKETGEPGEVRLSVLFYHRHRATGQHLDGRFRLLMRVEHGLVTSIDEYHDRLALEAFMKLVALEEYAEGPA
jgi:ketosteroid isomerase-like protein